MDINFVLTILLLLYVAYWWLVSKLIDAILEFPKLKRSQWLFVGAGNASLLLCVAALSPNGFLLYCIMMLVMLIEFTIFYKDSFTGALLCMLACAIHVLALMMITVSCISLSTGQAPYVILTNGESFQWACLYAFFLLDLAVLSVLKLVPLPKVKLINQHKEQQWFIIAWMGVSTVFLFYLATLFYQPAYPTYLSRNHIAASLVTLSGLYIVLFFSIKTSALLGYKEKNIELEEAIQQEQQYRKFMIRDAIASYEANITQDMVMEGHAYITNDTDDKTHRYMDFMILLSQKLIYSEDISDFLRNHGRSNVLRLFEKGEREIITEYRRLMETGEYIWVRSVMNLVQDTESKDIKAFVCVKNIDNEKKDQLELLYQAERDPLTGLYNRTTAIKVIEDYIAFDKDNSESALFMIDVDNFKDINDHLGHVFGDAVLCELSEKLNHIFRSSDVVGRIGGDEYVVFLKDGASQRTITEKAEEICKAFHITYQGSNKEKFMISSSIGISVFPYDGKNFNELYARADVALYLAKSEGKNNFKIYDGSNFAGYTSSRTEIQPIDNILQKGFRENRIEYVFKMLYQSENPVAAIHSVLELIAKHFSFERGYIFETSNDGKTTSNTFEWCAEGVTSEINNLQKLPIEVVATAHSKFREDGTFILRSLGDLQREERLILEPQGIKSMFQFGIFDKSHLLGFIGFDNCINEIIPSILEIDELKTICNILATFFVKQYIAELSEKDLRTRQEIINHLENYIYVVDTETFEPLFMNEKTRALMESSGQKKTCYAFFRGRTSQCEDCPMHKLTKHRTKYLAPEFYNDKLGIWMETSASLMRWTNGNLVCLINCADITVQKQDHLKHVHQLEELLYVDTITNGRTYQKFQIDAKCLLDKHPDQTHYLMKLDIANFKLINRLYSYEKGNEILHCVAKALQSIMRNEDEIYARIYNDEFVALFKIDKNDEIEELHDKFTKQFDSFVGHDFSFKCRFTHGRYIIEPEDLKHMTIHDMFEKVNIAHKAAKLDKAVDFAFYDEQMTQEALHVKEIENKMEKALRNNEFSIYLQPKYYLEDERIGGAEALSRWGTEEFVHFSPNCFIPVFEQNAFITKLDFYVFEKTCQTIKSWIEQGIEPVTVSVNFSRLHLNNVNFVKQLREIVDRIGIDRKYLEIEITESVIFENIDTLETLLDEIHKSGFSMSMDDFGSGYSSLGMLKDFAVDVLKIDRSFFANQRDAERSKIVVGSIIQMATNLGIRIVAEGVEEQAQIDFLRELHCSMVQGYYYAKPMPIQEFTELLRIE